MTALSSDDLPTFGRPTMAIATSASCSPASSADGGKLRDDPVEQVAGPGPWIAETGSGSPKPSS